MKTGLVMVLAIFAFLACKKWFHRECRDDADTTTGIIIRELPDQCPHFLDLENEEVIVRKTQWDSIWAYPKQPLPWDCTKPEVDFVTETLLVFHSSVGPGFIEIRNVERDEAARQYIFTIKQIDCSNKRIRPSILRVSSNMMVVPKLPDGWSVRFVTETDD